MALLRVRHSGGMRRRAVLIAVAWLSGALLAAAGVTAALNFLVHGILGPRLPALSPAAVSSQLALAKAASPPAPPSVTPSVTPSDSRSARPKPSRGSSQTHLAAPSEGAFTGGMVWATCTAGQVTLTNWSPGTGFAVDHQSSGPGTSASVSFTSGTTEDVVTATCSGGHPRFASAVEANGGGDVDRHGGRGGGGGHDDHGGGGGDG
jgi:hypothetical protein